MLTYTVFSTPTRNGIVVRRWRLDLAPTWFYKKWGRHFKQARPIYIQGDSLLLWLRFLQEIHMAAPGHRCHNAQYRAAVDAARYLPEGMWRCFPAAEEVHPEHACKWFRKTKELLLKWEEKTIVWIAYDYRIVFLVFAGLWFWVIISPHVSELGASSTSHYNSVIFCTQDVFCLIFCHQR